MLLRLLQSEELDQRLLDVDSVLSEVINGADTFEQSVTEWLERVEQALSNNRMSLSSRVSVAKASLLTSLHPAQRNRRRTRRERAELCVQAVELVVGEVRSELSSTYARLDEADAACRRLLAVAAHKGLIKQVDPASPHRARDLVRLFENDPDISGGVVQLDALLGRQDALIVVSRRLVDVDQGE